MIQFIQAFIKRFSDTMVSTFAASASFFILISSIPFLMLVLGFSKYLMPFTESEILNALYLIMPHDVYYFSKDIISELFSRTPISLISITAVTLLWSASRGVLAIIEGLNSVYGCERYNFFKGRLVAFFYTFIFILTLFATLIVLLLSRTLIRLFSPKLYIPLFAVILVILFASFYTYLPSRKIKFISQLPGAVLVSISWLIFTWMYSLYIDNFSNFSYVYGSLAAVVLLMLWLYICMMLFLCGAVFNEIIKK